MSDICPKIRHNIILEILRYKRDKGNTLEVYFMEHKTDGMLFKFALIFFIFTTIAMLMSGVSIYVNQTNQYKEQCEKNMQNLADYIESMMIADGKNFLLLQDYFMKHKEEMMIRHDFSGDYAPAKKIDLNYLKRINDTYGHEQGNIAIKRLSRIVCVIFAHSPVFRIGGDEFAVILKNDDLKNVDALVEKFNSTFDKMSQDDSLEPWEHISAAIGIALYDPLRDNNLTNVFKRADKAMYARKKEMKAVRT